MVGKCTGCGKIFSLTKKQQFNNRHGRSIYCSKECYWIKGRGFQYGGHKAVCKTCGKEFISRIKGKIYCNMKCYWNDPRALERLRKRNIARSISIKTKCAYCDAELIIKPAKIGKRNFCNHSHYRFYLADRFDRWIASPQAIALPQNYDEFLSQEELPCLIEGCDWSGKSLSQHMNFEHGITADQFKRLAGFNLKSGIVTPELSEQMRNSALSRIARIGMFPIGDPRNGKRSDYISLEAKEHFAKARMLLLAEPISKTRTGTCRWCGKDVPQPYFSRKLYCSIQCRSEFYKAQKYPLVCSQCGNRFGGSQHQQRRANRNLEVFCSLSCRQAHNGAFPKKRRKLIHA